MEDHQGNVSPSSSSSSSSSPSSSPNQQPLSIDVELWKMAEERAQEILYIIQPNVVAETKRKEVAEYVQSLIRGCYGAEVFPFGSVPLKTYLPDGDIDLTTLCQENEEEDLAKAVCNILESLEDSEYQVKDTQYIRAQVPVVKCTVKNIAVDISFNQIAGLSTLCFLEQVDGLVGRNHLFKRGIILIKAWCYYESRILGAHHGLLSTYAVETLVLYIMNLFHSSVRGPLEVLYKFLDYYSSFDWDSYCLSINGPVAISSLPEIVETPDCDWDDLLLSKEFMRECRDIFFVPARACETAAQEFPIKHLNIVDPLRSSNNLGRSVSRGNFHRIRFALSFGARKLREILTLPGESMGAALEKFFMNTLDRNGKGQRPDVPVPVPAFGTGRSEESVLSGDYNSYYGGLQYSQLYHNYSIPFSAHQVFPSSPSQVDVARQVFPSSPSQVDVARQMFPSSPSQVDVARQMFPSSPSQVDVARQIFPSSPSQVDVHALSSQQNWSMVYQLGNDLYVPIQAFYHPNASQQFETTFSAEEKGKSRGTGTYIPDVLHTYNSYYKDKHAKVFRQRGSTSVDANVLPKSHQKEELLQIQSQTDMGGDSRPFRVTTNEFPLLSGFQMTSSPTEAQGSVQLNPESEQPRSVSSSSLNIDFRACRSAKPLTKQFFPGKHDKPAFAVSTTLGSLLGVPKMDMKRKEKIPDEMIDNL